MYANKPVNARLITLFLSALVAILNVQAQECTCDLRVKSCDPNCCCDPDCTAADKESFTVCTNADINQDDRVCISDNVILFNNAEFRSQGTSNGLFCIYKDNFAERNFYTSVQTANTDSAFETLAAKYRTSSFQPILVPNEEFTSASKYKVGDKVWLLFTSNVAGYLSLPKPLTGSLCNDKNPAGFLQDDQSSCTRVITDLPSQCINDRSLNAAGYFADFKFVPSPATLANVKVTNSPTSSSVSASPSSTTSFGTSAVSTTSLVLQKSSIVSSIANSSVNATGSTPLSVQSPSASVTPTSRSSTVQIVRPTFSNSSLVNITIGTPILCRTSTGVDVPCSFRSPVAPTYDFQQNVCRNVVLKTAYSISYVEESSLRVSSVAVSFTFGDIKAGTSSIKQEFAVAFRKNSSAATFRRSGNPGYLRGQPLLAGTLVTNTQTNKEAIQLSLSSSQWLTIVRADINGACANATRRASVVFGMNVRSGCYISVKRIMTAAECQALQSTIYNTLLNQLPTHVAMFGNSEVTNIADWIRIINVRPSNTPSVLNGECQNIILGVQLEVLHSKTGFLANPQEKIVGVRVKYEPSKAISFQCSGPYCQPQASQLTRRIDVVQSVSFIDVSASLEARQKSRPQFTSKAPNDFFHPFV